ncbi:hypothetical protein ADUPG1_005666, partial [Aduncisulcus paluster]
MTVNLRKAESQPLRIDLIILFQPWKTVSIECSGNSSQHNNTNVISRQCPPESERCIYYSDSGYQQQPGTMAKHELYGLALL